MTRGPSTFAGTAAGAPAEIRITDLTMRYATVSGESVLALDRVSLAIRPKEFMCVVGTSGCGKTTLLRIIAGLVKHTGGRVHLRDREISGPSSDVGIVFQGPVLLPWKTVLENVMIPVVVLGLDRAKFRQRAMELLALVGLSGFENKYPRELSGGMQQRASIARALVHQPSLLLMDEPFGALDAMTRETMNLELQRIARDAQITVLFITHSIQEAVFLGDRVVVMTPRPGRIAEVLTIELPRPRELDAMSTPEFGAHVRNVRSLLNARGMTH
jgi:NitT/TauT family transport system ATP-binding protein